MTEKHRVVICGAGIAGVSAAYYLARAGIADILIVDELAPLTLTSDRSTECYRNWWPDPELQALVNRSIDLMEELAKESGNVFRMNRRGYLYVTADPSAADRLAQASLKISQAGGGPLRVHNGGGESYERSAGEDFADQPDGADLLLGTSLIRRHFPYLTDTAIAALHARRAGWLSAQQLGMCLLERARALGASFKRARLEEVRIAAGHVSAVRLATGEWIDCAAFVSAAGPHLKRIGAICGLDLPVHTELHLKLVFEDGRTVVGRDAPLMIWTDAVHLPWDDDERESLLSDPETAWLAQPLPGGAHTRPEGGLDSHNLLMLWDYKKRLQDPEFPPPMDDQYPEVALRGLSLMLPGLKAYFGHATRPRLDGGYYVKTDENRLLAGPTSVDGVYLIGAVSGYGIMSACAAGELLAAHIAGSPLPTYAETFLLARYQDPEYLQSLEQLGDSGEL
jgi:glycine/D-amino acid oxidase-like deaminating enzyme